MKVNNFNIHKSLFELGLSKNRGPCECSGNCCKLGAWIDVKEKENILRFSSLIIKTMDATQNTNINYWFNKTEKKDSDYPSKKCIETKIINKKCAFQDQQGLCSIQKACIKAEMGEWLVKPFYCIIYPLTVEKNTIKYDNVFNKRFSCCSAKNKFEVPLFESCKKELIYLVGKEGYFQIKKHYKGK